MIVDVPAAIGAVVRAVEDREHAGQPARVVLASRSYDTDIADLWDALTNGDRIPRWFLPISGDLRLGGSYQLQGNAGGTIDACEPPRYLALTWAYGGKASWVHVRLTPESEERTRLELEHIAHLADIADFWDQYGAGATGVGWDLALMGLGLHVATGAANDHKEAEAWTMSEEGRRFIDASSADWCRASIAAGLDEAGARAAADRTSGFYKGEAPSG